MPRTPHWEWQPPGDWVKRAACSPATADLFHPNMQLRNVTGYKRQWWAAVNKARAICLHCPVIKECAEHGMGEHYGIWGGLTPQQRGFSGTQPGRRDEIMDVRS